MKPSNRPFEGQALKDILADLAGIDVLASSLKLDLEPLSEDDRAAGAGAITIATMRTELSRLSTLVTWIAIERLKAESSEWYEAHDSIE